MTTHDTYSNSHLHKVVKEGNIDKIRELINQGANVNYVASFRGQRGYYSGSTLHVAAESGSVEMLNFLLANGAILNPEKDCTPLLNIAAINGHYQFAETLLEKGIDINAADWFQRTALHIAVEHGHVDLVRLLLKRGANPNLIKKSGETPFFLALQSDGHHCLDIIAAFAEEGIDILDRKSKLLKIANNHPCKNELLQVLLQNYFNKITTDNIQAKMNNFVTCIEEQYLDLDPNFNTILVNVCLNMKDSRVAKALLEYFLNLPCKQTTFAHMSVFEKRKKLTESAIQLLEIKLKSSSCTP